MKLKIYIAGKIASNSSFGTHDWRDGFCAQLAEKTGFEIVNIDPTKSLPGFDLDQSQPELVFGRNCYMEKIADLVVVYLSDDISVGGSQEMLIAKYLKKPLVGIAPKEGKFNKSQKEILGKVWHNYIDPYVFSACDKVVEDIDQLTEYLTTEFEKSKATKTMDIIDHALEFYEQQVLDKDQYVKTIDEADI